MPSPGLRASAGTDIDDSSLTELVGELSVASEDFRRMWARHDAHERTQGAKHYHTPLVGPITLNYVTFSINGAKGQTLYLFYAEPGTEHEHALTRLPEIAHRDDAEPIDNA